MLELPTNEPEKGSTFLGWSERRTYNTYNTYNNLGSCHRKPANNSKPTEWQTTLRADRTHTPKLTLEAYDMVQPRRDKRHNTNDPHGGQLKPRPTDTPPHPSRFCFLHFRCKVRSHNRGKRRIRMNL